MALSAGTRSIDGNRLVVYTPQIRSWPDFATIRSAGRDRAAPEGRQRRPLRHDDDLRRDRGRSRQTSGHRHASEGRRRDVRRQRRRCVREDDGRHRDARARGDSARPVPAVPIDDVLEEPPPPGFNTAPPPIYVADSPTLLLFVNGTPVLTKVEQTGLELVVNANFPMLRDTASGTYYLITGPQRLQARDALAGPWTKATDLPGRIRENRPEGRTRRDRRGRRDPGERRSRRPVVIHTAVPAELIVTDGKPRTGSRFPTPTDFRSSRIPTVRCSYSTGPTTTSCPDAGSKRSS